MIPSQPAPSHATDNSPGRQTARAIAACRDGLLEAEMRRAARRLLSTRRQVWWGAAFGVAVGAGFGWTCTLPGAPGSLFGVAGTVLAVAAMMFGIVTGKNVMAHGWLMSLRQFDPTLPLLPPDMPLHRWAAAVLRGERHVPGEIEQALTTLWRNESSEQACALARLVLARHHIPNVSAAPFEADRSSRFPLWQRRASDLADAPDAEAGVESHCVPWLVGVADGVVIQGCACGGTKAWDGGWQGRDSFWHGQPADTTDGGKS